MPKRKRESHSMLLGQLPEDILCDSARVTLMGRSAVLVEGQHGVVELGTEQLRLKTGKGILTVSGDALSLAELSLDAAMIRGRVITTLTYGKPEQGGG